MAGLGCEKEIGAKFARGANFPGEVGGIDMMVSTGPAGILAVAVGQLHSSWNRANPGPGKNPR